MAQDMDEWRALLNAVMSLRVPENAGRLCSGCKTGGLSGSAQFHGVCLDLIEIIFQDHSLAKEI
jgi:hypothetical protein